MMPALLTMGNKNKHDKQAGALSICVRDPEETKRVIEALIASLSDSQKTTTERTQ
jgi:hypothetical protein